DTMNHCIRKFDLNKKELTTYAGICGQPGFKDGVFGINQFNKPDGIGIDEDGSLYVYDSGNNYMRLIDKNGKVSTLIHGACFEYKLNEPISNSLYNSTFLLCLK